MTILKSIPHCGRTLSLFWVGLLQVLNTSGGTRTSTQLPGIAAVSDRTAESVVGELADAVGRIEVAALPLHSRPSSMTSFPGSDVAHVRIKQRTDEPPGNRPPSGWVQRFASGFHNLILAPERYSIEHQTRG